MRKIKSLAEFCYAPIPKTLQEYEQQCLDFDEALRQGLQKDHPGELLGVLLSIGTRSEYGAYSMLWLHRALINMSAAHKVGALNVKSMPPSSTNGWQLNELKRFFNNWMGALGNAEHVFSSWFESQPTECQALGAWDEERQKKEQEGCVLLEEALQKKGLGKSFWEQTQSAANFEQAQSLGRLMKDRFAWSVSQSSNVELLGHPLYEKPLMDVKSALLLKILPLMGVGASNWEHFYVNTLLTLGQESKTQRSELLLGWSIFLKQQGSSALRVRELSTPVVKTIVDPLKCAMEHEQTPLGLNLWQRSEGWGEQSFKDIAKKDLMPWVKSCVQSWCESTKSVNEALLTQRFFKNMRLLRVQPFHIWIYLRQNGECDERCIDKLGKAGLVWSKKDIVQMAPTIKYELEQADRKGDWYRYSNTLHEKTTRQLSALAKQSPNGVGSAKDWAAVVAQVLGKVQSPNGGYGQTKEEVEQRNAATLESLGEFLFYGNINLMELQKVNPKIRGADLEAVLSVVEKKVLEHALPQQELVRRSGMRL